MIPEYGERYKPWLVRPKLRPVEVFPLDDAASGAIGLRDPARLAPGVLVLSPASLAVIQLLDGSRDLREIQAELFRLYGELVDLEAVVKLIEALDDNYFLEGAAFELFLSREMEDFELNPVRPASLVGSAYPADADALSSEIRSYFQEKALEEWPVSIEEGACPRGLVAPHIDFRRGGPCYARAWEHVQPENPPDIVVILGTAHSPTREMLAVCGKDFETPYGPARCDREMFEEFKSMIPDLVVNEYVHRGEHSIEFQAVWLKHVLKGAADVSILPVLCGSFYPFMEEGSDPEQSSRYLDGIVALRRIIEQRTSAGKKVMVAASADLAHVGPQFGDEFMVDSQLQSRVRDDDLKLLERAARGDYGGFYSIGAVQNDSNHICGLSPIYTLIRILDGSEGRVLAYDQWLDDNGQGLVSFAGLVFY